MNAKETKEYAAANGWTIEPVGKRYKAIKGEVTVERGSYDALYNAMVSEDGLVDSELPPEQEQFIEQNAVPVDPFDGRVLAHIRSMSFTELHAYLFVAAGVMLDAVGVAYNMRKRNEGESDYAYRSFLLTGETLNEDAKWVRNKARQILRKERLLPTAMPVTHFVNVWWKTPVQGFDGMKIECHSYNDAVKAARRIQSDAKTCKNVARIEWHRYV